MTDLAVAPSPSTASDTGEGIPQSLPEKIKIKVDGVEDEVDLETIKKDYQKYKGSEKRFQEAAQMKKEADVVSQLIGRAQQGDLSWLKGLVPKEKLNQWAENELLEHINWQKMPEVERRAILAEQKAQEAEERLNKLTKSQQEEQMNSISQRAYVEVENDIVGAVKGLGYDVKITPRFVRRIAEQMHASLEASDDPQAQAMPAKLASEKAFRGLKVDAQELLSILTEQEALELIPPKLRQAIRRADVQSAVSQMPARRGQLNQVEAPLERSKVKKMPTDDWFSRMDKRFKT